MLQTRWKLYIMWNIASLTIRLLLDVEDTVDVKQIKTKDKRMRNTMETIGLWGGVLLWCVLCLLHQVGVQNYGLYNFCFYKAKWSLSKS